MVGCYLTALPRKFMRTMAGHPSQIGCFEIPHGNIRPPAILLSQIWPQLSIWEGRFGTQDGQINDLAAAGLTSLLFYLREVILQDSVVLRQQFPQHPVWNHPVFQHPSYSAFAQEVKASLDVEGVPNQVSLLYQAVPIIAEQLQAIHTNSKQQAKEIRSQIRSEIQELQQSHTEQLRQLFSSGNLVIRLEASRPGVQQQQQQQQQQLLYTASSSKYASALTSQAPTPRACTPDTVQPLQYRMSRAVRTVEDLWREWTVGLQGQPSVSELDRRWGSTWRAGRRSELQWYSLRLEVIKEIARIARSRRLSQEVAMHQLSQQQQQQRCSLDLLCKQLRAARKQRN
jgi:hypothetical protein